MGVCVSFDTDYGISSSQIRQSCCKIILIASAWPNKAWFTELLELSVHDPIKLLLIPKLLMQPGRPLFHNCPELLNLHAWMLQGNPSLNSGFPRLQLSEFQLRKGNPRESFMTINGKSSVIGVVDGRLIRSMPLFPCLLSFYCTYLNNINCVRL